MFKKDFFNVKAKKFVAEKFEENAKFQKFDMRLWLETSNSVAEMGSIDTYLVNLDKKQSLRTLEKEVAVKGLRKDLEKLMTPEIVEVEAVEEAEVVEPDVVSGKIVVVKGVELHQQYNQEQYMNHFLKSFTRFGQNHKVNYVLSYHLGELQVFKIPEIPLKVIPKKKRPEQIPFK